MGGLTRDRRRGDIILPPHEIFKTKGGLYF
nr:MAG TPA: hypothetical protein [Caudoviricetes sp.]DAY72002.1 MAG TPA: hypothetical protein [Caudoviricetes sp.]